MAEKLSKTIKIGEDDYLVYAHHADTATDATNLKSGDISKTAADIENIETDVADIKNGNITVSNANEADTANMAKQVENALCIYRMNFDGEPSAEPQVTYDGSSQKSITLVPATGGKFTGKIRVNDYPTDETINDEAILNYKDIKKKVVEPAAKTIAQTLSNNSILYTWENSELLPSISDSSLTGVSLVTGKDSDAKAFAENNAANKNSSEIWLGAYLYVCSDTKSIYFGSGDSTDISRLGVSATSITTGGITKDATHIQANTTYIQANTTKIENIKNGTTIVGRANKANNISDGVYTMSATEVVNNFTSLNAQLANIIDGDIIVKNAENANYATTASTASTASNAVRLGGQLPGYFQKKITISTSEPTPSDGSNGDIWIVYK